MGGPPPTSMPPPPSTRGDLSLSVPSRGDTAYSVPPPAPSHQPATELDNSHVAINMMVWEFSQLENEPDISGTFLDLLRPPQTTDFIMSRDPAILTSIRVFLP